MAERTYAALREGIPLLLFMAIAKVGCASALSLEERRCSIELNRERTIYGPALSARTCVSSYGDMQSRLRSIPVTTTLRTFHVKTRPSRVSGSRDGDAPPNRLGSLGTVASPVVHPKIKIEYRSTFIVCLTIELVRENDIRTAIQIVKENGIRIPEVNSVRVDISVVCLCVSINIFLCVFLLGVSK